MKKTNIMLEISNLKIKTRLILAPISGYADSPFRRIAIKHGAGLTVTELISAEGIVRENIKTMELLRFHDDERPIAIQIFGNNPETMGEAAKVVEEFRPDLIDINIGCPAKKVCNSGSGAALLLKPGIIQSITENIVKGVKIPVSAKIRIGWDSKNLNYIDTVRALEDGGISVIFVHGRTRAEQYSGRANWDIIKEICEISHAPIIGNGDIGSYNEAIERIDFSGCPAVMIGRGAIGNPWIFSGRKPEMREIVVQMKEHLDMIIERYGERGIMLMRKHFVKYIKKIKSAKKIRNRLVTTTDKKEIIQILDSISG